MKKKPIIVGICGPSASGKSYLANYISSFYKNKVSVVSYDSYCKDFYTNAKTYVDPLTINYDSPDSYDGELLYEDILKASKGNDINCPIYDFATHTRKKETKLIKNNDIILVEGILVYQVKELLPLIDVKVFITAREDLRFIRRSNRDIKERGRTLESVKEQWEKTVEPSRKLYIDETIKYADIVVYNDKDEAIEEKAFPIINSINELLK